MYSAPSRLLGLASRFRLTKGPRAFSVTVCGKSSKRNPSSGRKSRKKTRENDQVKSTEAAEDKKLKKGCVIVAENADGTVLFNFEPNLGNQQLSNGLTVLSTGQQHHTHLKLSKLAEGSGSNQLTYRLWDNAASSDAASASTSHSQSSLNNPDAGTSYPDKGTSQSSEQHPSEHQPSEGHPSTNHSSNGSTNDTLSLLLDLPSSSERYDQADIPEYSFAATQGSAQGPPNSAQRPPLLQKPVRPPFIEQPPSAHTENRFEKKEERWVPCYLWHESGLPKTADLRDFPYEFIDHLENSEDTVTSSDAPAPFADSGSQVRQHQAQAAAETGVIQQAWRPIHHLLLWVWRLLPYWFRSRFHGPQQRQPPAVHASRIVTQHTMAVVRSQAVEGSTYDLESGRSPTPLADVERYQIEDLIQMGVKNLELFRTALTAPSAISKDRIIAASFDRLEYLGDAAVALAFRNWVYARFPDDDEGSMTNTANTLVSNRAHVLYANHLHLTRYIAQNLTHQRPNSRADEETLADAFEALAGAVYLDSGLEAASKFLIELAAEVMGLETELSSYRNYKLYLVNSVNQRELGRVTYQSKKRGANLWQSKCRLQGKLVGIGLDKQRKQAESAAAYAAMEHLGFKDFNKVPVGQRPSRHADRKPNFKPMAEQSSSQAAAVPASKGQLSQKP